MAKERLNGLAAEKSPYLLQHSSNPVNWYPWSEEAYKKAKEENKPVFLSIGYSTCHWCHIMAHESFEDEEVAGLINETFVAIKVDREERPDIDGVYMAVCQMMTGSGGWPLTIILTPDKEPFFAATYIPKETRYGRIGLLELIPRIKEVWSTRRDEAVDSAAKITETLKNTVPETRGDELDEGILHVTYRQLADNFDSENGGFSVQPKFPTPHNLLFLLRYHRRTGNGKALEMVEKTLTAMRRGGIYDHIGYGFHRYSTDSRWLVPHFEKMLYDQALLATAYTEAYQVTGKAEYGRTAREIFTYVLRDITAPGGGFYSAEDADSEGEEGKYYLWTIDDIKRILTAEEADMAIKAFNVKKEGNFTDEVTGENRGSNILHMKMSLDDLATETGLSKTKLLENLEVIRGKLFTNREKRLRPHKDDKVLTDWNGLMIAALAKGAQVFEEPDYAEVARTAAGFILDNMRTAEGRLLHRYRDNEAAIEATIDDYAFLVYGLIELYEATLETDYLKTAIILTEDSLSHFWGGDNGGFYVTADDGEQLLIRQKEIYDGAIPSGNSIAMLNLLRLGRITGRAGLEERAVAIGRVFSETVRQVPMAHTQLMVAADFAVGPSYEIVVAGDINKTDTKEMLKAIRSFYIPGKVLIHRPVQAVNAGIDVIATFARDYEAIDGKATAYICENHNCHLPVTDIGAMIDLLGSGESVKKKD
jgi:uncharacterized protein YyaL (SSP411 family)